MNLENPDVPDGTERLPFGVPDAARAKRRIWPWILGAAILGLVIVVAASRGKSSSGAAKGGKPAAARAVPVVGLAARLGDLGVYQTGLGTITGIATVTVRSRVDGQLLHVAFQEGQLVKSGDLLAQIDPRPFEVQLHQAEAQLAKDAAALENTRLDLARYESLVAQGLIPEQQRDAQRALVGQGEASLQSDRAQIESAKLNLTYSRITAPIAGRAGLRLVDPGNMVHASDPNGLLVVTQLQPIAALFTIPADQLPPVLKQMRTGRRLPVEAWNRDMTRKLAMGTLEAVDNQIDQATGTVRLKALFANTDGTLLANQFVNARLLVDTLKQAVLIPTAALQRSPQSTFVWVVKPDETADMRTVDVQLTEGDVTAVKRGVTAGEIVIVDGVDKLQPGTKVTVGAPNSTGAGAKKKRA